MLCKLTLAVMHLSVAWLQGELRRTLLHSVVDAVKKEKQLLRLWLSPGPGGCVQGMGPSGSRPIMGLWASVSSPSVTASAALLSPADLKPGPAHRVAARCCRPAVLCPADSSFLLLWRAAKSHYFYLAVSVVFSESDGAFFRGPGHWGKPGGHQCLPQWLGRLESLF